MIDIHSFLLALGVGNIAFAVLMAGYTHGAAPSPGLRLWMWARFGIGLCQLLGWSRPYLNVPVLNGIEGAGWVLAISFEVAAYCIFFGFERWQRNLAVAIGNALHAHDDAALRAALVDRREACSPLVREHIDWALAPLTVEEEHPT